MNRRDPSGRCWWGAVIGLGVYAGTVALEGRKFNWWAAAGSAVFGLATCGIGELFEGAAAAGTIAANSRWALTLARGELRILLEGANFAFSHGLAHASPLASSTSNPVTVDATAVVPNGGGGDGVPVFNPQAFGWDGGSSSAGGLVGNFGSNGSGFTVIYLYSDGSVEFCHYTASGVETDCVTVGQPQAAQ